MRQISIPHPLDHVWKWPLKSSYSSQVVPSLSSELPSSARFDRHGLAPPGSHVIDGGKRDFVDVVLQRGFSNWKQLTIAFKESWRHQANPNVDLTFLHQVLTRCKATTIKWEVVCLWKYKLCANDTSIFSDIQKHYMLSRIGPIRFHCGQGYQVQRKQKPSKCIYSCMLLVNAGENTVVDYNI